MIMSGIYEPIASTITRVSFFEVLIPTGFKIIIKKKHILKIEKLQTIIVDTTLLYIVIIKRTINHTFYVGTQFG